MQTRKSVRRQKRQGRRVMQSEQGWEPQHLLRVVSLESVRARLCVLIGRTMI